MPQKLTPESAINQMSNLIDECFDKLFEQNLTSEQSKQVALLYTAARDAYWLASEAGYSKNNAYIDQKTRELAVTNKELKADLETLQDVSKTLKLMERAVSTALALAALLI